MKKLTLLKSLLLAATLLFSIGISNLNADTYSYSFSAKVWSAYGDQTLNGVTWTASATGGSYFGYDATKGQQFGSAGSPANPLNLKTSGISGTITSIKVSTSGASSVVATFSVSVGGTAFTCSGSTSVSITATNTTYEFTGSGSGQIVLSWSQTSSKALYIKDIQVTYTLPSNPVAATPTFSPAAGTYTSAQSVTISCTTPGATIYYTTDGSTPDNTKTQYTGAISVTATTTIKARAYASGYDPSAIASATYTINVAPTITVTEVTLPAFSATAGNSQDQTITVNGTNLTGDITLALSGTDADLFSLSQQTITPASGTVTDKVITITYAPTAPGSHAATLTLSSSGATDVIRDLTGTASLTQPTVNTPTNITNTGLTLNWNSVTGATEYEVNVYTKTGSVEMTDKESFDGITPDETGKLIQSATYATGWSASSQSTTRQIYTTTGNFGVASPSFALTTTGDFIQTNTYASPITSFSFWAKQQSGATSSTLIEGYNGTSWVEIATLSNADVSTTSGETKTYNLTALGFYNITQIKMTYTKVAGNLSIDDVTVTYGGSTITLITGSPFTVSATSLQIGGLTPATTYYYTVTAKNGSYVSPASDEASASTLGTATSNVAVRGIFVRNGQIVVTAPAAGERIEIFNAVGQRLVSKLATAGENAISVSAKGVLVVKFGSEVTKVIVP
ncbi:MAG: chitobiase/beta-hexosaminidase C-terminal domain-containing protein [Paludibacteraceae bacterium]|nr:chitobiase/beta-hexosaminidase C-terminal domain-containing protein [Paludibacteraceae bacterium]